MPATSRAQSAEPARPGNRTDPYGDVRRPSSAPASYGHAASTEGYVVNGVYAERPLRARPSEPQRRTGGGRTGASARQHPEVAPLAAITAPGGALVAVTVSSLAAILDALLSPGLGVLFGFVFVLSSVLVALRMCWYDAWSALAMPPLVFIVAAGVAAQIAPVSTGGWLRRTSTDMAIAVLDHPVYLLAGTLLAALAIVHRARVE